MDRNQSKKRPLCPFLLIVFCVSASILSSTDLSFSTESQMYEPPPVLKASKILTKEQLSGPYHTVEEKIYNDGFLNHFKIQSKFGGFNVMSMFLLKKRLHEIGVIAEMEKISTSGTVMRSLKESGRGVATGVTNLVTDPGATLSGAGRGIGNLFGRVSESVRSNPSQAEDSRTRNIIGMSRSKRQIAAKLGVDVYSANETLQNQLDRLAWADFSGGIGVGGVVAMIPGGAGLVASTSGAARLLNDQINETPPAELRLSNRQKMMDMAFNHDTVELFLNNTYFSPREQTWLVAALEKMKGVSNKELFLKVGLQVNDRSVALLITQMAVMYAGYNNRITPVDTFHPVDRILYAQNKNGAILLVVPSDYMTWNDRLSSAMRQIKEQMQGKNTFTLWTVGDISKKAADNVTSAGWVVHTHVWPKLVDINMNGDE